MQFEKNDIFSTHTVTSSNILVDNGTGRVVATFYNDYDLDYLIDSTSALKRSLEIMTNIVDHVNNGGELDGVCIGELETAKKVIEDNGGYEFTVGKG